MAEVVSTATPQESESAQEAGIESAVEPEEDVDVEPGQATEIDAAAVGGFAAKHLGGK